MADVLELDNAEEFEVDDEGDRKCTPLCIMYCRNKLGLLWNKFGQALLLFK